MYIQFSDEFYEKLKFNRDLFATFCYNYFFNNGDQQRSKKDLERKFEHSVENFNLMKNILRDEKIDYFIDYNGEHEVFNPDPNSLGKNIKPEDWEVKDEGGKVIIVGYDKSPNAIGFGPTTYVPSVFISI